MVVFLYKWKIKSGKENQFEVNWALVTKSILENCGSFGSRLHLAENGEYMGYAQWPDKATRERCSLEGVSLEARRLMGDAIESSYPEQCLEIKTDLLVSPGLQKS